MLHCISIDWLSLYCRVLPEPIRPGGPAALREPGESPFYIPARFIHAPEYDGTLRVSTAYEYKTAEHGTRQFKHLDTVSVLNEEIAQVQYEPCSSILKPDSVIVKFNNRLLYRHDLWEVVDNFLRDHRLEVQSISRVDVCADFNEFDHYKPIDLIADFLKSKLRHKGHGIGAAYFNHFSKVKNGISLAHLEYSGLAFGSRESDARAYLYNKSLELKTQTDKPYIRQFWREAGLNLAKDVWRLEISIKAKGTSFRDKKSKAEIHYNTAKLKAPNDLCLLFYTYQRKLFSFVYNRPGITNISREPIIPLFSGTPHYEHRLLQNISNSNRTERVLIKQLWQIAYKYRGCDIIEVDDICKTLATDLADSTGLRVWLDKKKSGWTKPLLK